MSKNNFTVNFSNLTQFEVDVIFLSIIDNAIHGRVTKLEKERLWDLSEELCISIDSINSLSRIDLQLICDSLYRYANKYHFEEREGLACLKIADYIVANTRGCYYNE